MNVKRVFGTVLTILGIVGLIYAAFMFMITGGGVQDVKMLAVYGILGLIFFIAGIGLVRNTQDKQA